jgi:glycosyltransferase involved in cell wall biosynthesis
MSAYDCVVSWEELTCNDFLALNVKAKRKIGYIHPDYKTAGFDKSSDISVLKRLDAVVGVSESTANTLKQVFTELKERITYVPNVLDPEAVLSKAKEEVSTFEKSAFDIVTVCRLDIYTKGLDRIVRVAKMLDDHGIKYQWYIIGDGNDQKQLAQMIEQYSTINVHLLGSKDNPYPYVYNADLFVLLSNYEGRPMAVDEAIILGTPVLVTNYASAREQVDNTAGFVVEMNDDSIYEQLRLIIDKTSLKKQKRKQTNRSDLSKFTDVSRMVALLRGSAND